MDRGGGSGTAAWRISGSQAPVATGGDRPLMHVVSAPPGFAGGRSRESIALLTQAEAAKLLRCSVGKLARERRLGKLAYVPGRPVLLRLEDVLDWLDRRRVAVRIEDAKSPMIAARQAVLRRRSGVKS